jgi:hypothetical protein
MSFPTPTENMHVKLNVPAGLPRWATDSGVTLEPSEGQKDSGWTAGKKPPARWMNWIQNLNYGWAVNSGAATLSNWFEGTKTGTATLYGVIYHPGNGLWMISRQTTSVLTSPSGHVWTTAAGALTNSASNKAIAIDSSYFIVGTAVDLGYSTNGAAFTNVASATLGGSGAVQSLCTKYPNSDFIIITRDNTYPRIGSTGVTGSWVGATTNPPSKTGTLAVLHLEGSTWAIGAVDGSSLNGILSISTDDGDNWNQSSADPTSTSVFRHMAYNPDSGRILYVGLTTGNVPTAEYTDDLGSTWSAANFNLNGHTIVGALQSVYYCGGGLWITVGSWNASNTSAPNAWVSKDDGENWQLVDIMDPTLPTSSKAYNAVACDGRKMLGVGNSGEMITSLTLT